jgi:hypothetical protein
VGGGILAKVPPSRVWSEGGGKGVVDRGRERWVAIVVVMEIIARKKLNNR